MTALPDVLSYHLTAVWAMVPPGDSDPSTGHGPEWGKAAPIGLLIWLLLGIALFLLIKSMNRNLRRVPKSFDGDDVPEEGSGETDGGDEVDGSGRSGEGSVAGDAAAGEAPDGGDGAAGESTAGSARRGS